MPAYDRPIVVNLPPQREQTAVAAVIRFNSTDMERIRAYLERMQAAGVISSYGVNVFDPALTTPELYFP